MPSRNKQNNKKMNRQRRPKGSSQSLLTNPKDLVTKLTGHVIVPISIAALSHVQAFPLVLNSMGTRITEMGVLFQEFCFTRLELKIHAAGKEFVVAYAKTIPVTAPTVEADAFQLLNSRLISAQDTNPQFMVLTAQDLRGGLRQWYSTVTVTGEETIDETQGSLYIVTDGASGLVTNIELGYSILVRGPTSGNML
jgi:hypothetical protein